MAEQVTERIDEQLQQFLRDFKDENGKDKYRLRLSQLGNAGGTALLIDFDDLIAHAPNIARQLLDNPNAILHDLELAAYGQLKIEDPEYADQIKVLKLHFRKLPTHEFIRKLGAAQIGHLTAVDGIIVRSTEVHPLLTKGKFQCRKCNAPIEVEQNFNRPFMRGPGVCAHCFPPTTIISGHYKPIEEYTQGENIVSGCGEDTEIKKVFTRQYDGALVKIKACGILPFEVTPEHPLLTVQRGYAYTKNKRGDLAFIRTFGKPCWKEAGKLEVRSLKRGDYLTVPRIKGWITQTSIDLQPFTTIHGRTVVKGKGFPLSFPLDKNTAWLCGLYVAQGCSNAHGVRFCLGAHKKWLRRRVTRAIKLLGYSPSTTTPNRGEIIVELQSRLLGRAFEVWFGKYAHGKCIPDFILYNYQQQFARAFLNGYWAGDGCKATKRSRRASTVSQTLAFQLQLLAARLGIFIQISKPNTPPFGVIEDRLINQRQLYSLSYNMGMSNKGKHTITTPNYILVPITNIEARQYSGTVYNFETSHETYAVHNLVVHNCRSKIFEFIEKESSYLNSQQLRIQERPEDLPPGQLPQTINVRVIEDLVNTARPGDRVTVTAIVKAQQNYVGRKVALTTFQLELEANYIEVVGKEVDVVELTPEDERKIVELSKDPFIHRKLIASLAPSIYGYGDIKEGVLYLLFGGVAKQLPDGMKIRGEINLLIVGDPGIAKSQLLQYVARAAPRGLYTSGKGTSSAGLTAAVLKDKSGGMVLEAGALVLADKGVCAIDEMDKMRPEDRVAIHEVLEQRTVSIAKAGIVATLNARAAVLAAANPAFGRYDPYKNLIDNINLPVTLLSRFDLIFIMKDTPNIEADDKVARHILTLHRLKEPPQEVPIDATLLRKYVGYAKKIEPILTDKPADALLAYYMKMRSSAGTDSPIAITARQLEALVRLCEGRARAALRTEVNLDDANAVIRLTTISMQEAGVDVATGKMDIDVIMSGTPQSMRDKIDLVIKTMRELEKQFGKVMDNTLIVTAITSKQLLTEEDVNRTIQTLIKNGKLYEPAPGKISLIG